MRSQDDDSLVALTVVGVAVVLCIVALSVAASWYHAGVQQRVWARQGIHMTQWEIFVGADPAQKTIQIIPSQSGEVGP